MFKIVKTHISAGISLHYEAETLDDVMSLMSTYERGERNKEGEQRRHDERRKRVKADVELSVKMTDRPGTHPAFPSVFAPVNFAEFLEEHTIDEDGDVVIRMTPQFRDDLAFYLRHQSSNPLNRPPILTVFDSKEFSSYLAGMLPIYRNDECTEMAIELSISPEFRNDMVRFMRNGNGNGNGKNPAVIDDADDIVAYLTHAKVWVRDSDRLKYIDLCVDVDVRDKIVAALELMERLSKPGEIVVGEPIKWELPEEMKAAIVRLECAAAAMEDRDYSQMSFKDLRLLEKKIQKAQNIRAAKGLD